MFLFFFHHTVFKSSENITSVELINGLLRLSHSNNVNLVKPKTLSKGASVANQL